MQASGLAAGERPIVLHLTAKQVAQVLGDRRTSYLECLRLALKHGTDRGGSDKGHHKTRLSMSLLHGLCVLAMFDGEEERTLSDIAKHLGHSRATAERYAKTLEVVGLLEQDPTNRRYRLGRPLGDQLLHSCAVAK